MPEAGPVLQIVGAAAAGYGAVAVLGRVAPGLLRVRWRPGIWVVPLLAGVAAALAAPGEPTGIGVLDALLRAAAAAAVSRLAGGARRSAWLVAAAVAGACAATGWPAVAAFALLGAAVAAASARRWSRTVAAGFGALLAQVLFHLERPAAIGATAAAGVAVVAVLAVSWWQVAPKRERRAGRAIAAVAAASAAVVVGAAAVAGAAARSGLQAGVEHTQAGLDAARAGDLEVAADRFAQAAAALGTADDSLGAWWARPGRAAPVLGRYLDDAADLAGAARAAAGAAERLALAGSDPSLHLRDGGIDLAAIADAGAALDAATGELRAVRARVADPASGPWLPGPASRRLDDLLDQIDRALVDAEAAALAIDVAPDLLGAAGPRRWFVAVHTPSEPRGAGGLIGFWGDITVDRGQLALGSFEAVDAGIEEAVRERATLPPELAETLARYQHFGIETYFKNGLQSPDFPTDALAIESLVPQAGYGEVDGVLAVDPIALAALLELSGPIEVPSWPEPITAENAQRVLLFEQYVRLSGDPRDAFLGEVAEEVFRRLTTGELASPAELARVLGPALAGRHVLLHSADPDEQQALVDLGVAGELPAADGGDFVQIVTQNSSESKLEWFLQRELDYRVAYDPATGDVEATLTLTLRNDAPPDGLPAYILGTDRPERGLAPGHLESWLSVYSALELESATFDGQPLAMARETELGRRVHSAHVQVPPRSTGTVELRLRGRVAPGEYRLTVGAVPTAQPDRVTIRVGERSVARNLAQISPLRFLVPFAPSR